MDRDDIHTPVLIVGAGPVGMTLALLLARMGVPHLIVDQRRVMSYYPKSRALNVRSLEIFRQCGIEKEIYAAVPFGQTRNFAAGPSLVSPDLKLTPFGLGALERSPLSPSTGCLCPQDWMEPIIYRRLRASANSTLWLDATVEALIQDEGGVRASVRLGDRARPMTVRADYLVAADGARRGVATMAGINATSFLPGIPSMNIIFKAKISDKVLPLDGIYIVVSNPAFGGTPIGLAGIPLFRDPEEWSVLMDCHPEWGDDVAAYTNERCIALMRALVGMPDLEVSISRVAPWVRTAAIADRFVAGRVALAGDCAHLMPPTGALGLNTGLQDVSNLAWRIAALVRGQGSDTLLEDYHRERHPESNLVVHAAVTNEDSRYMVQNLWSKPQYAIVLGFSYDQGTFVPDGTPAPHRAYPYYDYIPSGRPGGRAPHLWLDRAQSHSTLDLFGSKFTLLTARNSSPFQKTVRNLKLQRAEVEGYALEEFVDAEDLDVFRETYGITDDGAVLVRPDGVVAWRGQKSGSSETTALHDYMRGFQPRQH